MKRLLAILSLVFVITGGCGDDSTSPEEVKKAIPMDSKGLLVVQTDQILDSDIVDLMKKKVPDMKKNMEKKNKELNSDLGIDFSDILSVICYTKSNSDLLEPALNSHTSCIIKVEKMGKIKDLLTKEDLKDKDDKKIEEKDRKITKIKNSPEDYYIVALDTVVVEEQKPEGDNKGVEEKNAI